MSVAAFSHFSAASELLVTAGVFYFFWRALRHNDFRWTLVWTVIAFETLFNITYMAGRFAAHEPVAGKTPSWATALFIAHGTLSLVMFVGLVAFVLVAFRHERVDRTNLFRARLATTWTFLTLWTLSVATGEALYVLQLANVFQV